MKKVNFNSFYSLTAASVERYLSLTNWTRDYSFKNKNLMVFDNDLFDKRIAIPANENYEDFYVVLESVLETVSFVNKKDINEVINEITSVFFDRLEFRIISELSNDGKLPLDYAANCIEGLKDLILYSASAEQKVQPICNRVSNSAKLYLDKFKLGQTDVGSFIINIDTKVVDDGDQMIIEDCNIPKPIEHKIVERIYESIIQIDSIVNNKKTLTEIASNGYESGITANMCEAFIKMKPDIGDVKIDTTIRYSAALTKSTEAIKRITVENNHFYAMNEIAKIYRDKEVIKEVELKGIIKSLSKQQYDSECENTIKLVTYYEGNMRTITAVLSNQKYRIACDAHKDELEVKVSGVLDMSRRNWELTEVSSFDIISK